MWDEGAADDDGCGTVVGKSVGEGRRENYAINAAAETHSRQWQTDTREPCSRTLHSGRMLHNVTSVLYVEYSKYRYLKVGVSAKEHNPGETPKRR